MAPEAFDPPAVHVITRGCPTQEGTPTHEGAPTHTVWMDPTPVRKAGRPDILWRQPGTCLQDTYISLCGHLHIPMTPSYPYVPTARHLPPGHLHIPLWRQPGTYRQNTYMKLARAPVSLIFRTFNLVPEVEFLDVYDGAATSAKLLARFSGAMVPGELT